MWIIRDQNRFCSPCELSFGHGLTKSPLGGWGKYFVVALPHTHCTPQRRSFTNTSHCSNGNFAILRWLSWFYSNKHSSIEATILNNSNLFRHLFISYAVAAWFMFFHDKTTSSSFQVRSSSFDYVSTLFLNRNVNNFSITLFSFIMCVSDSCVNICWLNCPGLLDYLRISLKIKVGKFYLFTLECNHLATFQLLETEREKLNSGVL